MVNWIIKREGIEKVNEGRKEYMKKEWRNKKRKGGLDEM